MSAPASLSHVACDVRRHRQLSHGIPRARPAGLRCRDRMLLSRIGAPFLSDWKTRLSGSNSRTAGYLRVPVPAFTSTISVLRRFSCLITFSLTAMVALLDSLFG